MMQQLLTIFITIQDIDDVNENNYDNGNMLKIILSISEENR